MSPPYDPEVSSCPGCGKRIYWDDDESIWDEDEGDYYCWLCTTNLIQSRLSVHEDTAEYFLERILDAEIEERITPKVV